MVVSIRKWLERLKFIAVFLICTYALVQIFNAVTDWIAPVDKYKIPQGRAVKVFQADPDLDLESDSITSRIRLFYWLGE
ncbi:DUF4227 family protein [Paenibacillus sp. 1001270B_150601_E10]|uniref:DUF4227 family protein n=1 Tax=Paenibacillus sp. 1001270B_150601_E10 TaxID=2787079 RepID=UPI00189FF14F|nr:DUF4227 family protein [Paenibacillus sp. 1001270B_150601_E10]